MDRDLAALNRLLRASPPAELDALVRERMHLALAHARFAGAYPTSAGRVRAERPSAHEAPVAVPLPERCLYAVSLVVYGVQAAGLVARLVWRTFAG